MPFSLDREELLERLGGALGVEAAAVCVEVFEQRILPCHRRFGRRRDWECHAFYVRCTKSA